MCSLAIEWVFVQLKIQLVFAHFLGWNVGAPRWVFELGFSHTMSTAKILSKALRILPALAVALIVTKSDAQLGVTFGLDSGTKSLISGLPEQIRVQIFKLLQDSLPLIDKSVEKYLLQIDQIVRKNVSDTLDGVQCTAIGTLPELRDATKGSLIGLLFNTGGAPSTLTPSNLPDPLQRLSAAISETRERITVGTKATEIKLAYADLLHHAAITKCQTKISSFGVVHEVEIQTARLFLPALEWQMLVGDQDRPWCDNPRDCIIKRRSQLAIFVRDADPRDTKFSSSEEQFDALELMKAIPGDPPAPSFLDKLLVSRIPILQYEAALASFRNVERTIAAHRQRRKDESLAKLKLLIDETNSVGAFYTGARNSLDHPTDEPVDAQIAFERSFQISRRLADVLVAGQRLVDDNHDIDPEFAALKKTADDIAVKNIEMRAKGDRLRHH